MRRTVLVCVGHDTEVVVKKAGAAVCGMGAHVVLVDDAALLRLDEADSATMVARAKDWSDNMECRLLPGGKMYRTAD